jgi:hypothetical protein
MSQGDGGEGARGGRGRGVGEGGRGSRWGQDMKYTGPGPIVSACLTVILRRGKTLDEAHASFHIVLFNQFPNFLPSAIIQHLEYLMDYRGPGFLAVV